ncbi:MAG: hypothetical protein RL000_1025 [Bacteroidota bacterium]|jgi:hypothetical protein
MDNARPLHWAPSLQPFRGQWDDTAARHLLRRTQFGVKLADLKNVKDIGLAASLDNLLNDQLPQPLPPVKDYNPNSAVVPDVLITGGQTWVNDPVTDGTINSLRRASFKKWWVGQMLNQQISLREKMTLFWHNHFATESVDIGNAQYLFKHHSFLRKNALGNFKHLVREITTDPAMLVYLNGQNNNKSAPDENYAREIQELFVIGKGKGSGFNESDVKAAARVLTGWRNNAAEIKSLFDPNRHDINDKQFSEFYQNKKIVGRTGVDGGAIELGEMIDMLFATNEVALYLCRRLYVWFIHYQITPEIEEAIIVPLAQAFRQNNYEIKPVLRLLLESEHFFDPMNRGCQIKSPVDMLIGMLREMEVKLPSDSQYTTQYGLWNQLVNYLTNMQQNIGDPPDVSGWKAYYQEPGYYKFWINTDTLPKRIQYLDSLVAIGYTFGGFKMVVDGVSWIKLFPNPEDPNSLVEALCVHLLGIDISAAHKAQLKTDFLLAGQSQDYYWTDAWELFISTPSNMANTKHVSTAVTSLIKYLVDLPEYQLC